MTGFTKTIAAVAVTGALIGYAVYDHKASQQKSEALEQAKFILKNKATDVTKIEIKMRDSVTGLEKIGNDWRVLAPVQDQGDTQSIEKYLEDVYGEQIIQTVSTGSDFDPKVYGLDQPLSTLTLTSNNGRTEEVKIGQTKAYDGSLYAQIGSEPKAYLVSLIWDAYLSKTAKDFRSKYVFRKKFKTAEVVKIEIAKKNSIQEFQGKADGWHIVKGAAGFAISDDKVKDFLGQVEALRAQEIFAAPFNTKLNSALTVTLSTPDQKFQMSMEEVKPNVPNAEIYFRVASTDVDSLMSITQAAFGTVNRGAQDFYDKALPFKFDPAKVSRVQYRRKGLNLKADLQDGTHEVLEGSLQSKLDPARLKEVVEKVAKLEAVRVFDAAKASMDASPLKEEARLDFFDEKGQTVFALAWGALETEKGAVELQYLPARTNLVANRLALPEASIKGLGLDKILN